MAYGDEKGNKSGQTIGTILFLSMFVLIGIGLVIFGVVLKSMKNEKKEYFQTTDGWITDVEWRSDEDGTTYYPVYSYSVDGNEYKLESSTGYGSEPAIGTRYTVWYDPGAPYDAFVDGDAVGDGLPVVIGIMFIGVAGGMIVSTYVRNARLNRLLFGILVGVAFMAIPFLFCVIAPDRVGTLVRTFLTLFGLVGAFIVFAGIHDFFRPDKPLIHTGGAVENDTAETSEYASQVYEFVDDHKETIDKVTNVVAKGHMMLGLVIGTIAGVGFVIAGLVGIIIKVSSIISGGLLVPQLMMLGFNIVFIIVGVVLMVKSIKAMRGR